MYKLKGCPNVVSYEEEDIKEFIRDGKHAGYIFLIRMELLQNVYDLMKLNAPKINAYVSGAGFAAPKSTATVYAGNTGCSSGNETKYADSSVYMPQAAEQTKKRSLRSQR